MHGWELRIQEEQICGYVSFRGVVPWFNKGGKYGSTIDHVVRSFTWLTATCVSIVNKCIRRGDVKPMLAAAIGGMHPSPY